MVFHAENNEIDEDFGKRPSANPSSAIATLYQRRHQIAILAVLWIFHVANLAIWESRNRQLLAFDEVGHFLASCVTARVLEAPWVILDLPSFFHGLPNALGSWVLFNFSIFPPFVYLVTAILYFFSSPSLPVAALTNAIFLLILLVAVCGIADDMLGYSAGVAAAFLVSAYPLLVGLTRLYFLDFPLTAMVALSLFLLTRTKMFQNRKNVILLSVSLIFGMLTRHTFPLYVLGPILYVMARSFRDRTARNNIVLCIAIASVSVLYYIVKPGGLGVYQWYVDYTRIQGLTFSTPPYIAALVYLKVMAQGIGYPLFMLFSGGLLLFIKLRNRSRGIMLAGILTPILLLGVVYPVYYDPRFVAPILPVAAVASSSFFKKFNWHSRSQLSAVVIIGLFVMAQFASITYDVPILSGFYTEGAAAAADAHPPIASDWKIPEILNTIQEDAIVRHDELPIVVALSIDYHFDQTLFEYYAYVGGISVIVPPNYGQFSTIEGIEIISSASYVVTRSDPALWVGGPVVFVQNLVGVSEYVQSHLASFVFLANYTLPDGSVASLYRRIAALPFPSLSPGSPQVRLISTSPIWRELNPAAVYV